MWFGVTVCTCAYSCVCWGVISLHIRPFRPACLPRSPPLKKVCLSARLRVSALKVLGRSVSSVVAL